VAVALPLTVRLLAAAAPIASQASASVAGGPSVAALSGIPPAYLARYMSAARTCLGLPWGALAGTGEDVQIDPLNLAGVVAATRPADLSHRA
jgi:hypothetical protein